MQTVLKIGIAAALGYALWKFNQGRNTDAITGEADDSGGGLIDFTDTAQEFFDGVDSMTGQQNTAAFLAAIRLGEGTSGGYGYWTLYGGGRAESLDDHPALNGWAGLPLSYQMAVNAGYADGKAISTAAGAYQINRPTWRGCAAALGLEDFEPASQDAAAVYLIKQKGALADVTAGRTAQAIAKLGNVWASLPGAAAKQRQVTLAQFNDQFTRNGGLLA